VDKPQDEAEECPMTTIDLDIEHVEARLQRRLRLAGVATLLAAALGSVWSASTLAVDPVGDQDCVMQVAEAVGFSGGCAEEAEAGTGR
jgi:hypothetical protein